MAGNSLGQSVDRRISDAASVLILSPALASSSGAVCADLLDAATPQNLLWIAYGGRPSNQVQRWETHVDRQPVDSTVVSVSETGSTTASSGVPYDPDVQTISAPTDLTGLGIQITKALRDFDDEYPTRVCFDSLTALLQYVEFETVYEFLHVVSGRIYAMDATAHFHLDPGAHDEQTIASITTLADVIVEVTDDDVRVRSR